MSVEVLHQIISRVRQDIARSSAVVERVTALNHSIAGSGRLFASITAAERRVLADFDGMQGMARGVCLLMLGAKALHVDLAARASAGAVLTHGARAICATAAVTMHVHGGLVRYTLDEFMDNLGELVLDGDVNSRRTRRLYQQSLALVPQVMQTLRGRVLDVAAAQGASYTAN
eukprot:1389806-Rhodomonas_salina.1